MRGRQVWLLFPRLPVLESRAAQRDSGREGNPPRALGGESLSLSPEIFTSKQTRRFGVAEHSEGLT